MTGLTDRRQQRMLTYSGCLLSLRAAAIRCERQQRSRAATSKRFSQLSMIRRRDPRQPSPSGTCSSLGFAAPAAGDAGPAGFGGGRSGSWESRLEPRPYCSPYPCATRGTSRALQAPAAQRHRRPPSDRLCRRGGGGRCCGGRPGHAACRHMTPRLTTRRRRCHRRCAWGPAVATWRARTHGGRRARAQS